MKWVACVGMLVLLAGCGFVGGWFGNSGSVSPIVLPELRTGTRGVVAEFLANSPPDEVFAGTDFLSRFSLHNVGAASVQRGLYALEANPGAFIVLDESAAGSFQLTGKSQVDPVGEKGFFEVRSQALALPGNLETISEQLVLHACYAYSTIASATVCVDTAVGDPRSGTKICQEGAVSLGGGQGGPVSLTSVKLQTVPLDEFRARPQVELTFVNHGGGEVMLAHESDQLCSGRVPSSANKVRVQVFLSEVPLSCSTNEVTFKGGSATISCVLEGGIEKVQGTFYSILRAEIDYGYHQVTKRAVRVKRVTR